MKSSKKRAAQFDSLLETYLRSSNSAQRRQEAGRKLAAHISHPAQLRSSPLLTEDNQLVRHSYIISDAFEAVTNGMYNPGALERLEEIPAGSPLQPWKTAVYAVLAFYQGDTENMQALLQQLPQETPPAALAAPLRRLAGVGRHPSPGPRERELLDAVAADPSFIRSAASQLRECLSYDMAETFAETSLLLVRELAADHPLAAKRLALWSMKTAAIRGYALELYPSQLEHSFGSTEGMRLAAMALRESDPDIALLFLIRCLLQHMREDDLSPASLAAYFSLIADWAEELEESLSAEEETPSGDENRGITEYMRGLASLTSKLEAETRKRYPQLGGSLRPAEHPDANPLQRLRETGQQISRPYRRTPTSKEGQGPAAERGGEGSSSPPPFSETPRRSGDPQQLELF
jgi:hypothetical protein